MTMGELVTLLESQFPFLGNGFFFFFLATWHSVHEKAMRKYEDVSNGHIQTCGFSSPTSHTFFN